MYVSIWPPICTHVQQRSAILVALGTRQAAAVVHLTAPPGVRERDAAGARHHALCWAPAPPRLLPMHTLCPLTLARASPLAPLSNARALTTMLDVSLLAPASSRFRTHSVWFP